MAKENIKELEIKHRIKELVQLINKHNHLYHDLDKAEISDEVFDSLLKELERLETEYPQFILKHSPTQNVGGKILEGFQKVKHNNRQYSFDKIFNYKELQDWENKNNRILDKDYSNIEYNYICELKIDGLKLILSYRKGILILAATRGDGTDGEDITQSVKNIKDIPRELKDKIDIDVIGECWLAKSQFEKINKELEKEGKDIYANPRNLAAGTLRNLNTDVVRERELSFFAYQIDNIYDDNNIKNKLNTQGEALDYLLRQGFTINKEYYICESIGEIQDRFLYWDKNRNNQEYAIDGLVIKINQIDIYYNLGWTNKSPRAAVAYKFTAEEAQSVVEDIICQVGRTGAITPVAIVKPVEVAGSVVRRATLHNKDIIDKLDIRIGDSVILRKAGDIIPEIYSVLIDIRPKNTIKYIFPERCPECNTYLNIKATSIGKGVIYYCINNNCKSRLVESLIHFVSKKAMNIEGMGDKIIEEFYQLKLIDKNFHSIYNLKVELIKDLFGYGLKSAENIINAINKSKDVELDNFIYALGIRHVGETTAKDLASHYGNINNFINTTREELLSIKQIGEETSKEIIKYLEIKNNIDELEILSKILKIKDFLKKPLQYNTYISNKIFVITGTLSQPRDYFKKIITENGGKITETLSKNTNYLLMGESAGSKLDKAKKINIKIIDEKDFNNFL